MSLAVGVWHRKRASVADAIVPHIGERSPIDSSFAGLTVLPITAKNAWYNFQGGLAKCKR